MHILAITFFVALGLGMVVISIFHEWQWQVRERGSQFIIGYINRILVEYDSDGTSYRPEVRFEHRGTETVFISKYASSSRPSVGDSVRVLVPENGGPPEIYTAGNRLLFTVLPFIFGAVFILVGLSVKPLPDQPEKPPAMDAPHSNQP